MSPVDDDAVPAGWAGELVHLFRRLRLTSGVDPVAGKPLSLREIARRSGYVPSHVRDILKGTGRPSRDAVVAVATALNTPESDRRLAAFYAEQLRRIPADRRIDTRLVGHGPPIPRQLPHDVRCFVGREAELARLTGMTTAHASAGATTIVVIHGPAGIGKKSLAIHFAHRIAGRFPDGHLHADLRGFDLERPPMAASDVLERLLRSLGIDTAHIPAEQDERIHLYRSVVATKRMLLLLDDAATAEQVRPLVPATDTCLALITSRDRLTELVARDGAHRLTVDPLTTTEAMHLLARIAGDERVNAEPQAAMDLARLARHVPLTIRIAGERLSGNPRLQLRQVVAELADDRDSRRPPNVGSDRQNASGDPPDHAPPEIPSDSSRPMTQGVPRMSDAEAELSQGTADIGLSARQETAPVPTGAGTAMTHLVISAPPHKTATTGTDLPALERRKDHTVLRAAVTAVASGRGGLAWIEGEPGIGKSTLMTAVLAEAAALQCQPFKAVGDELSQRLPLRMVIDALGAEASEVLSLLYNRDTYGIVRGSDAVPAAVEQLLVIIDRLCATAPVVLAFDDLQWADEASLLTWRRLSLAVNQIPLLLIGACRPVPVRPAVAGLRRGIADRSGSIIPLQPLDDNEIAGLVGKLAGGRPGPQLRHAVSEAGGNPLYIRELVDALVREDRVRVDNGVAEVRQAVGTHAPKGLAGAIRNRLDFLSTEATAMLRIAAVLGPHFSVVDLVTVTGQPASDLVPALDEAVAAGIVAEADERLEFRHGLIRAALYETTTAATRSALHRQVARTLADAGHVPADQVAVHLMLAPDAIDTWAVDWLAEHAYELAYRAPQLAADLLATAARRCTASDPRHGQLLRGQARALLMLVRLEDAETVIRQVLESATDPAVTAETAWILASIMIRGGRYTDALADLDQALARPAIPPVWQARLHAWRAKVLPAAGKRDEGQTEARRALDAGTKLGDRLTMGHALQMLYMLADYQTGLTYIDRALDVIGDDPETTKLRTMLLSNRAENLEALGRLDQAERSLREALVLAERDGIYSLQSVQAEIARFYVLVGRWDDAWVELAPLTSPLGFFEQMVRLGCLAFVAAHRHDSTATRELLNRANTLAEPTGYGRGNAALLWMARAVDAEQRGGAHAAAATLAHTVRIEDGRDLYDRSLWLPDLVRVALTAGNADLARAAATAAEADAADEPLPRRVAAARRARAVIDGDIATLLAVADEHRSTKPSLALGQTCEEAAILLARAGDNAAARTNLTEAIHAYAALGATWDIRRADTRLHEYGIRRSPRSTPRRSTTGWESLTSTEKRIAAMVGQGRSNPDIATELLHSRRTVQTHVTNILTKLGFDSRADIAQAISTHPPS